METVIAAVGLVPMVSISGNVVGEWIANNVFYVLLVLAALSIAVAAITKKPRDAALTFGLALLAVGLLSIAAFYRELGEWVRTTFLGG